jgi:uncharacterized protein YycO
VDIVLSDGSLLGARSDYVKVKDQVFQPGVQIRPAGYNQAEWKKVARIKVPFTFDQKHRGLTWAHQQIGKPYDKLAILGFVIGRNWRDEDAWFCAELVERMKEIAYGKEFILPYNKITPGTSAYGSSSIAAVIG